MFIVWKSFNRISEGSQSCLNFCLSNFLQTESIAVKLHPMGNHMQMYISCTEGTFLFVFGDNSVSIRLNSRYCCPYCWLPIEKVPAERFWRILNELNSLLCKLKFRRLSYVTSEKQNHDLKLAFGLNTRNIEIIKPSPVSVITETGRMPLACTTCTQGLL